MLRGVNRRIIEVNTCDSDCIERAIFIIRADASTKSEAALRSETDRMLADMTHPPRPRRRKYKISRRALWLMTVLSTAAAIVMTIVKFI